MNYYYSKNNLDYQYNNYSQQLRIQQESQIAEVIQESQNPDEIYTQQESQNLNEIHTSQDTQSTKDTFKAYVDTMIPRTPDLAEEYGKIQYFGALDFNTDEYLILSLDSFSPPLANATADILDTADKSLLPVVGSLNRFTMMGYYSEWFGYGKTRLDPPNQRTLEFYPLSWKQVGYPGPSLGYRILR